MAKRKGPNKSEAIRVLLTEKPDLAAKEVISTLGEKGIKVNNSLIYFVKGKLNAKTQRKKRVISAAKSAPSQNGVHVDPIALIQEVKAIAQKAGGYDQLKALVDALAE